MDKSVLVARGQEDDCLKTAATDRSFFNSKLFNRVYQYFVVGGIITAIVILMKLQQQGILKEPSPLFTVSPREQPANYVVYNPSCKIPDYPIFSLDVLPDYKKVDRSNCTSKPLLTSIARPDRDSDYVLVFNNSYSAHYVVHGGKLSCCYYVIQTSGEKYRVEACRKFDTNVTLPSQIDIVGVKCRDDKNSTVYRMHHFLVPIKSRVRNKIDQFYRDSNGEWLSVMIIGLDSVSRLNLRRTMTETVEYLEKKGWYTFPAYHKVQYNTFYNLVGPILTGHLGGQLKTFCWPDESDHVDNCPYIWKNFSERYYITAYGEDSKTHTTFTWLFLRKKVFREQPTDYYLQPHMAVTYEVLGTPAGYEVPSCVGPLQESEYVLDFSAEFASSFVNYPTFSLFWLNLGHGSLNGPQALDKKFTTYFNSLESSGVLNRSMILFLADHGFHKGWIKFSETHMGLLEHSLPFLYIWLPDWFKSKYPHKVENLVRNKHRLVSHFDVYLTMMDVLGVKTTAAGCPTCVSLFDTVPWNRGCTDAGISGDICACDNYEDVQVNSLVERLAELVVARINVIGAEYSKYLQTGYKCSTMHFKKVKRARREVLNKPGLNRKYIIDFYAGHEITEFEPALFEAVVTIHPHEIQSISQFSQYRNRSHCMNSREGKQWCTCQRIR